MWKIRTLNNLSPKGLDLFNKNQYQISSELEGADALLLRSFKMHNMEFESSLKAVGRAGAGVNNIPIDKLSSLGIPVFNTPGANANAVKELTFTAMLMTSRNIVPSLEFIKNLEGSNEQMHKIMENQKKEYAGNELWGKTLGVIGLGAIGVQVANTGVSLGMKVVGFDPGITIKGAWSLKSNVSQAQNMEEVVAQADYLTFHVPLSEATTNLLSSEKISLMKKNAVALNFSRLEVVNEKDIVQALDQGKIKAYATDFPTESIKNHPKVLCTPHLGASTREAEENCAIMIAEQLMDFLQNGNIQNSVNFPNIHSPRTEANRLTIANSNIPNMVGQMASVLAEEKLNIVDMVNKSKQGLAYTIIDVDRPVPEQLIKKIENIPGILKIRTLK